MAASVVYTNFNGRLVHENRGGVERGYVPDTLGSTIALVDSTGTITDTWSYWPYGEVASHTGSSTTPFTFVGTLGYYKDLVSKLTYVRARFYQAFTGQWMTTDPLWPHLPACAYAHGKPTSFVDPSGMIDWCLIACRAWCWLAGAILCSAIFIICAVETVITIGGIAIPCALAILVICGGCAAASSVCSDLCPDIIDWFKHHDLPLPWFC